MIWPLSLRPLSAINELRIAKDRDVRIVRHNYDLASLLCETENGDQRAQAPIHSDIAELGVG